MIQWNSLENLSQLEEINADSFNSPQIIFKHSTTCPISHMAKRRVEENWVLDEISPFYLDLKSFRQISDTIASMWKVQHESPQIIVIRDGKSIYNESHLDINISTISNLLSTSDV